MLQENGNPHIVMLNKAYPPWTGGIERHVRDISEALAARGWRVTALVCNSANFETKEMVNGVRIVRAPAWGSLLSQPVTFRYYSLLQNLKPDLLHAHVPFPLAWFTSKRVSPDVPIVCSWHSDIIRQRWMMGILSSFEQNFLKRCARIFPTSSPLLEHSRALRNHQERCRIVPLAVPPAPSPSGELVQAVKSRYPGPLVLFVGRLVGYKGLPYLIQAMASVEANLLIAGEGPLWDALERQANQSPHPERIHFLGHVSEMEKQALYRAADVFVLPSISRNEAFGYVLLEAMTAGCPVISTDLNTGVRWVNQHEESGLVAPPCDAQGLAAAINRILTDESLHAHLADGARRRVQETFRFDDAIAVIETEYRALLR